VPPFHRIDKLDLVPLDEKLAAKLRGRRHLLFVGRLAPNKGHHHLIRALAYYRHHLDGQADLVLVGRMDPGLNNYREELQHEVRRQRLHGSVHFAGKASDRQLKTYYAHAAAFLCASEHEGFCVPLVEAMYFGIPIVAYAGSAVADTLGECGLVWQTPAPALLAESIRELEQRSEVRDRLVRAQRGRYDAHFSAEALERRLEAALAPILGGAVSHV